MVPCGVHARILSRFVVADRPARRRRRPFQRSATARQPFPIHRHRSKDHMKPTEETPASPDCLLIVYLYTSLSDVQSARHGYHDKISEMFPPNPLPEAHSCARSTEHVLRATPPQLTPPPTRTMAVGDSEPKKWYKDKEKILPGLIAVAVRAPPGPGPVFPQVHAGPFLFPLSSQPQLPATPHGTAPSLHQLQPGRRRRVRRRVLPSESHLRPAAPATSFPSCLPFLYPHVTRQLPNSHRERENIPVGSTPVFASPVIRTAAARHESPSRPPSRDLASPLPYRHTSA